MLEYRHGVRALAGVYEEILQGAARAQESTCKCVSQLCFVLCNLAPFDASWLSFTRAGRPVFFVLQILYFERSRTTVRNGFPSTVNVRLLHRNSQGRDFTC